jgi:DNA-binding IclR family transcriptional regulator
VRGASSAPTERVLDVVELLSHPGKGDIRFSDVVRELDLSQGTAHAILKTLSDRGWVTRDPATKAFTLGPALTLVASSLDTGRPLANIARAAVRRLADTTDMPASVLERVGDDLMITAFEHPADLSPAVQPNERIPYTPPFGIAFAAWDTANEQEAWMARGAAGDAGLRQRLRTVLTHTRERGYDVDWMTPALSQAAQAIGTLSGEAIPHNLRSVIDQLRVEFASANSMPDDSSRGAHPVATISAPVLGADDRIALVLAIHPLRAMTIREIRSAAKPLLREVDQMTRLP